MADSFIVAHLRSLPLFAQLTPAQASRLTDAVEVKRFNPGDLIFRERQPAQAMVKFIDGGARLWQVDGQNQQQLVGTVGANQYINDAALLRDSVESATLQVIEPSLVLLIYRARLVTILAQNPDITATLPATIEGIPAPPPTMPSDAPRGIPRRPNMRPPGQQPTQRPAHLPGQQPTQQTPQQPQQPPRQSPVGQFRHPTGQQQPAQSPAGANGQPQNNQQPTPKKTAADGVKVPDEPFERVDDKKKVFRSQRDNEKVIFDVRRHWWAYARKVWFPTLIAITIIALSTLVPPAIAVAMDGFSLVVFGIIMIYFYLEWRNDHLIVTNQRVLHIERVIITFQQKISDTPLESVQEVNADEFTADPFSRIFQFGKLEIRTPGDSGNITFTVVPEPIKLQKAIFEHRNRAKENQDKRHEEEVRAVIDQVVMGRDVDDVLQEQIDEAKKPVKMKRSWLGWQKIGGESGEVTYRKHWLFWLQHTIWPGLVIVASVVFLVATFTVDALSGLGALGPVFAFLIFLVGAIWFYWADWDWRNDMYIINDETVEIVHKRPLWLQSENDQVFLNRIDNVVSDRSGLFQTLFDYGDVRLSLVGADVGDAKVFRYVPNPQEVQAEITKRQEMRRRQAEKREEVQRQQEIAEYLRAYHDTVGNRGAPYGGQINPTEEPAQGRGGTRPPNIPRSR